MSDEFEKTMEHLTDAVRNPYPLMMTCDPIRAMMKEADRLIQRFGTEPPASMRVNSQVAEAVNLKADPLRRFTHGDTFDFCGVQVTVDNGVGFCVAVSYEAPLEVAE